MSTLTQKPEMKKRIFEWYKECKTIGIIPEELQLIPEDPEQENKGQPKQKKVIP